MLGTKELNCVFELWCWKRLLRVSWIVGRSNQSILKEINPEYSLEGLMLKHQFFWSHDAKSWLTGKTLMLWKIEGRRRRGWQRMRRLNGITDSGHMNLSKLWEMVEGRRAWRAAIHGVSKSLIHLATKEQQNTWWKDTKFTACACLPFLSELTDWAF